MELEALVQQISLSVEPPSLNDTASDWQRIERGLRAELPDRPVVATLTALRDLGLALRQGAWQIVATVADVGDAWRVIRIAPARSATQPIGLAIDLGTTTIVAELVDLASGEVLGTRLAYNAQRDFGIDVTARMMYAEKPGGLLALREAVRRTLNDLIMSLCLDGPTKQSPSFGGTEQSPSLGGIDQFPSWGRVDTDQIAAVVFAGNTIMGHLLLGLDPSSIRREPYVPATTTFPVMTARELELDLSADTPIYLLPAASGYVGGDVTAGLLATHLPLAEQPSILIDIGTNGETILGCRDFLLACSGSAGSAFEGCGLEWGMAAQPGAIDRVWVDDGHLAYRTVSNAAPSGICGSGLIETLGACLQAGIINRNGKVNLDAPATRRDDGHPVVVIAPAAETTAGRDLALRQGDIENLIRDKAALFAGSRILLANAGLTFADLAEILIAGNFGQSLDIDQAVRIGLLPDIPRDRIRFIGNSSLAGARAVILSRAQWQHAQRIAASITCLELTAEPKYFEEYTAALFLPHTDLSLFPAAG